MPASVVLRRVCLAVLSLSWVSLSLAALPPALSAAEEPAADPVGYPTASHSYSRDRAVAVVERRVIGRSVQGRRIVAIRKGNPAASRTVVLLGQMHGDEPAGPQTARWVIRRLPVDSDVDLWVVPTMNPDGSAAATRRNARGVDLNRNWPTDGWTRGSEGSIVYGGPRAASEPETRAFMAFLEEVEPTFVTSIHQPFGSIGRSSKDMRFPRRLSRALGLPLDDLAVGNPDGTVGPTMTGWHNAALPGVAVTVEFTRNPTRWWTTVKAGRGILEAMRADW